MFTKYRLKAGIMLGLGLLAFGAFGMRTSAVHAQTITAPVVQACNSDQANSAATGTIDAQCDSQSGVDTLGTGPDAANEAMSAAAEAAGTEAVSAGPDTDTVQSGDQSGNQVEDGLPDLPSAAPEAPGV